MNRELNEESKRLAQQGVLLSWCDACVTWQIPSVDHVLFTARFIEEEPEDYWVAIWNGSGYGDNLYLLAAAIWSDVHHFCRQEPDQHCPGFTRGKLDLERARRVVAQAILDLLPEEAKCLFSHEYTDNLSLLGVDVPVLVGTTRDERVAACSCRKCDREQHDPHYDRAADY